MDDDLLRNWWIIPAVALAVLLVCGIAYAGDIPKSKAIDCIIGEAEGEGAQGMAAIAHAIRNRGTLKGCYGVNAPRVRNRLYTARSFLMAVKAWDESKTGRDGTNGATGWGNKKDIEHFKRCNWWKKCRITAKIGNHYFYKCS